MTPMTINTLRDLELKKQALIALTDQRSVDWGGAIADQLSMLREILVVGPETERDFQVAEVGEIIGGALTAVVMAQGNNSEVDTLENRAFARNVAEKVVAKLNALEGQTVRITEYDLSVLIEAILVEVGAFDVAKTLVTQRANLPHSAGTATDTKIMRRNGQAVPWNVNKIEIAVRKAFLAQGLESEPAVDIARLVDERVHASGQAYVGIETIQDVVQQALMERGHYRVAEAYIVYRAQRALMRVQEASAPKEALQYALVPVTEADGSVSLWDGEDLRKRIEFACMDLDLSLTIPEIEVELRRSILGDITRKDLTKLVVMNAKSLMEKDADFAIFAGRMLLTYMYEESLGWDILRDGVHRLKEFHARAFAPYIARAIEIGRLSEEMRGFNLEKLALALDPTADMDFDFLGIQTLYDRYLITDKTNNKHPRRLETPQIFWMRVAMGLFRLGSNREDYILELYGLYKSRRFCSSTPTLFNAGTARSQLSSCYLYKVDDSIESIMLRGIAENAFLSKWAGGLGGSWTSVRGTGGHIHGTNGESQGVIPFLKMHNDQLVAVNQGGKRAGSGCAYLEVWHNDIFDFLELRRNTGDERRRTHDMNTANWIPDLFMKRMEDRQGWTLFRANETPDLHDLYGSAFDKRYAEYEKMVDEGKLWGRRIEAIELWKQMLKMLFETGHPWITFKDPCNVRSPQDHAGVVHSSNLCTEITLNTSADETAVCNLGSVVIDNHIKADGSIDHAKLRETVRIAVRALDNVIDINYYPTEAARRSNERHRPVGLGVMGLQNALYKKGVAFASEEAVEFNDEMMEAIAYYAYEASSDLAAERGTYSSYKGSKWDRGLMPQDTLEMLEIERGRPVEVPRGGRMDWQPLREKIAKQGMRNSNVLAIAPTATIANIMGTSPCIEPVYKNLFVKSNLSGDFVVLNPFMVRDLRNRGLWNDKVVEQIKYFDGDLTNIEVIPEEVKQKYLTAFQIDYKWIVDAAARRQKWIDQSQSVNLFLGTPDMKTLSHMYRYAWVTGLKTTYYLRTLGASNIEKATVAVQRFKQEDARSVVGDAIDEIELDEPKVYTDAERAACSIESMRLGVECEACQ